MEPNQPNINMLSYSFSSSSSGNFANNSKKSEQIKSQKSILRKEGSTSKSKDKHATFVEPLSQVSFYVPDAYNQNKNQRISLNTVTEEAENSHSGSDLVNNLSSNRISITSEQRINLMDNNDNNNNSIIPNFSYNKNIEFNNNINTNQQDTYFNDNNNNNNSKNNNNIVVVKNRKKPKTRKTLDSDYYIEGLERNTDIYENNIQKEEKIENKENKSEINNRNNDSKFLEVRLSNSGVNNFKNDNSMINLSNQNIQKSASSDNSTNEKIEQQTKINTEVNKNLFKLNNPIDLNNNSVSNPQFNNNQINQNINIDINNQTKNNINSQNDNNINLTNLNNIIPKKIRKPQTNKRVTLLGIASNEYDNDSKTMFANLSNYYLNNI